MSFPKYPEYKDSGVEWLGEVPAHWALERSDSYVSMRMLTISAERLRATTVFHYSIPVVQETGDGRYEDGDEIESSKLIVSEPMVLVSKLNPRKGTTCLADPHDVLTVCSGEFVPLVATNLDEAFLHYIVKTGNYKFRLESLVESATRSHQRVAPSDISRFHWAFPPREEQTKIAAFLDHQTGKIDALIEEQRRLIELLKEKRQAVISHAVTKGLDPHVPMKDSGVEWLGEVPVHWELWKVSHAFRGIGSGTTPPSNQPQWYEEGTVPWVTTSELRESSIVDTKKRITERALSEFSSLQMHPPGSLVIAMYGATIGRLGFLNVAATTNQACCVLSRPEAVEPAFAFYWFLAFKDVVIRLYASGGGQPNINQETIAALRVAAPSRQEQQSIAQFLHQNLAGMDALIEEAQSAISLFQERRSALISSAVTGKIDVRGWQAGVESDEPELAMVAEEPAGYSGQGGAA